MNAVRRAREADLHGMATTLAAAFADGPWLTWTVAADGRERRARELFAVHLQAVGLRHGRVWTTEDHAAVAAWSYSESAGEIEDALAPFAGLMLELLGDRAEAAAEAERLAARLIPPEPHWELGAIGVHPARQRHGLGGAVLEPGLACCDADGLPAALQTSVPANVAFYERRGFAVTEKLTIPGGGPPVWAMRREPR